MIDDMTNGNTYEYSGKSFVNMINKYFVGNDNKIRNLTFEELDPESINTKLNAINGKYIYGFTDKTHKKITPKFALESDKAYHIYEADINKFNQMNENEQIDYLKTINYNGLNFGIIDQQELQSYLKSNIKMDINYSGTVKKSETSSGEYWWNIANNDLDFGILANKLASSYRNKVKVNFAPNTIDRSRYIDKDIRAVEELISTVENSGLFIIMSARNPNPEYKYSHYYHVTSKKTFLDEQKRINIFSIFLYPTYNGHLYRVRIGKTIAEELNIKAKFSYTKNQYEGNIREVREKILYLASILKEQEEYRDIAEALEKI